LIGCALCWTFIGSAVLCYAYAAYVILCAIALKGCIQQRKPFSKRFALIGLYF